MSFVHHEDTQGMYS